jgi:hypothetical protein
MKTTQLARPRNLLAFPFDTFRNISGPEDIESGRKVFTGQAPISSILPLTTDENVRDYLLSADGLKRRRPTQVNEAIRDTLENRPGIFSILNGGVTILARGYEVDDKSKILKLRKPSIINGSQTQGVIRDYFHKCEKDGIAPPSVYIKYELIITEDEGLIAETSIARNYQNDVMTISIAGRLGQLDEIEERLNKKYDEKTLKKKETQRDPEKYIDTEKLLQVIAALVPKELVVKQSSKDDEGDYPNKVYTYSMKAKCLKDFQEIYKRSKDSKDPEHDRFARLYEFYLDIAAEAQELYEHWKSHQGFYGTRLWSIERTADGAITDVPDGIVFPIISSLSNLAEHTKAGWTIKTPEKFLVRELINTAAEVYKDIANHNPWNMGKSRACYSALYRVTSLYSRLAE